MSTYNEHLLIIGGSKGIGFDVARYAVAKRFTVTIASRNHHNLEHAQKQLPEAHTITINTNEKSSIQSALQALPAIHHIFYSAGSQYATGKLGSINDKDIDNFVHERVLGPLYFIKQALNTHPLRSVTFTSGMLGVRPKQNTTLLSISCTMIDTLVQSLAIDYPNTRFNSVAPGITLKDAQTEQNVSPNYLNYKGHAQQVASLVCEVVTNTYINGANLNINGAQTLA